jgi:hypothetical protein
MKQEKLLRHILEAIEESKLETKKVNLYKMNAETSRGVEQLRDADLIKGTFHEIVNAPLLIEGIPWLTLKGQEYLEKLRWRLWRRFWAVVGGFWALIIGASYIRDVTPSPAHIHDIVAFSLIKSAGIVGIFSSVKTKLDQLTSVPGQRKRRDLILTK